MLGIHALPGIKIIPELLMSRDFLMAGGDNWEGERVTAVGESLPVRRSFSFPKVRERDGGGDPCVELRGEVCAELCGEFRGDPRCMPRGESRGEL